MCKRFIIHIDTILTKLDQVMDTHTKKSKHKNVSQYDDSYVQQGTHQQHRKLTP